MLITPKHVHFSYFPKEFQKIIVKFDTMETYLKFNKNSFWYFKPLGIKSYSSSNIMFLLYETMYYLSMYKIQDKISIIPILIKKIIVIIF